MQSIIRNIVWVCLAVIPFLALHVANGQGLDVISWFTGSSLFFPFIAGKNLLFRFFVEIAFAGWAILALYNPTYRINIKKSPIIVAYGVFILILLVADIFGVDPMKSIWSNFERMEGFVGHVHFFAYFFVLSVMVRSLSEWQKMWKFFVASNILVLFQGAGQLLGAQGLFFADNFPKMAQWFSARYPIHMSGNRLDATIGNSAYFGVFCLMYVFIAGVLWSQTKDPKKAWWYPLLITLNVIGVFYSGTRGSIIGLVIGGFVTLGILAWKMKGTMHSLFIKAVIVLVLVVGSVFVFKESSFIKSSPTLYRIASISPGDITTASRFSVWSISFDAWKEKPILGYGQDNFSHIFASKFLPEEMCNLEPWYDRSHNVFFDWLVAAGILGLLSYLSLYGVTLWFMWKKENDIPILERAILTGLLAGYFIHNIFVFDNLTSYILFFAVLAYIVVRARGHNETSHARPLFNNEQMNLIVVPLIGIMLLITLYYVNYRPLVANTLVIRAMSISQYMQTMSFTDAVKMQQDSFTQAIAMNTLGSLEAREQFLQMIPRMAQIKIPDELAQQEKQSAVVALNSLLMAGRKDVEESYETYKNDVRMLSLYGVFYNGIGDGVGAEKVLTRALELAPNKQLIAYDLIRSYLLQQKFAEAYALGRTTYDLGINCNNALKWYLLSAAYNKSYKEAHAYAVSHGQSVELDPDVLSGLVSTGQQSLVIELLQDAKVKNPELAPQIDAYIKQILAPTK
ncbi:MAG: hypothetical protein RLZZ308_127 [Candidatus Parcubacteria bacterium]|jgi:O-antigen ligase